MDRSFLQPERAEGARGGTPADEAHFVGRNLKAPILKAFAAHIFFDDQESHVKGAADSVPSGLVPGPHLPNRPIVPAE